ncbi:MAG: hypothetical protein MPEBLZ_02936 [Candidatus Methanoperedens nitroreducens]|uniref:DUF1673 family protein n=1 Tax=Candidatus Methanoperedens nitratireducens TaxID=1392998 RepID=A0A0P8CI63_9EURY|nr:DUF1673 family protein [Candidatus Methanoperedens sp. BLZ2]KAB2944895.1 MAG: DUF1673 family protein [Candidatus Methanoperedens sp.]KPQ42478.1 MAG: hypothetical protein MPEBLZ_02936 [Candidatus Methanoperedens sp. BLZ1]MBZ0173770.1 DUF1673 family protein [Candidatus Methanoperedens nitroreducens]CAG0992611.1 hypothetical protein METP2_02712 [Methanosarcinales archaeon]MCX9078271.1 DUF1673 family protein [Candidatus Methanoperedens sp.]
MNSRDTVEVIKKMMGWCPVADTKTSEPPSGESFASKPEGGGDASGKSFGSLFEWDYIVKEELLRSIAVLFYTFIGIGSLIKYGYIKADLTDTFFLAPIVTFAFFVIMVLYRKNTLSPIIYCFENTKPFRELAILIAIYAVYLYFSLQHPVLHSIWILIILYIASKLGKIFELNRPTGVKMMLFVAAASAFVLIRYYALQLPLMPLIKGILTLEAVMLVFVVLSKWMGFEEPDYLKRMDRKGFLIFVALIVVLSIIGAAVMIGLDR